MLDALIAEVQSLVLYMRTNVRARMNSDRGASAVEYGLLVAAIAAVIVAVVFALGTLIRDKFSSTSSCIQNGASSPC